MWKGYYGKEPFDLRLTVLRMFYKLPVVIAVTLLGSLLFGGGYYVKNVLLQGESRYAVTSRFRIEYAVEEEKDVGIVYINEVSWNTYLQTELVLDAVHKHLTEVSENAGSGLGTDYGDTELLKEGRNGDMALLPEWGQMDSLVLAESMEAVLASDLRVLATVVTTGSPEESLLIAKALEQTLTEEFAEEIREIVSIEVIDAGNSAEEVIPDVRTGRAFILSGVLSCFFAFMILLLRETGDDSIWLPASLWKRYGVKALGTVESRELAENMKYFFHNSGRPVALCASEEGIDLEEVLQKLKEKYAEAEDSGKGKTGAEGGKAEGTAGKVSAAGRTPGMPDEWDIVAEPLLGSDACERLRQASGTLLVVRAGRHAGRRLERVLEHLEQQDCQVTAALLWEADEKLIRRYYWEKNIIKK